MKVIILWQFSQMKASGPCVEVQETLKDLLFLLQLGKGKKKELLQNLKTLEYILQFPGLYATSCKCYVIVSTPWKIGLYYR